MKKELIASTALVGALTFGATVQAEEFVVGTETQARTTQEQVNLAQATYESSQEQVANLENQIVNQETVVAQQEESVANVQTELTAAEELVKETAQAAEEATEENIVNAQTAIKEANQDVAEKTDALETVKAEANIAEKEGAVNTQEGVVAEKEADVAQKQEIFDADKEKLEKAEQAVKENATAIFENEQYQSELTDSISEAKKSIQDAEEALERAKEAEASKKSQLEQAKTVLENAKTTLAEKESVLALAEKQLNEAKKATQSAQDAITALEDKYGIKQTITLPESYVTEMNYLVTLWNKYYTLYQDNTPYIEGTWTREVEWNDSAYYKEWLVEQANTKIRLTEAADVLLKDNNYSTNSEADDTVIDYTNLTPEQQLDLSLFTVSLINQVREQIGSERVELTDHVMDLAKQHVNNMLTSDWSFSKDSHYTESLRSLGLLESLTATYSFGFTDYSQGTWDNLKKRVYDSIVGWLNESGNVMGYTYDFNLMEEWGVSYTSSWGHAQHVLGVNNYNHQTYTISFLVDSDESTVLALNSEGKILGTVYDNPYETYATLLAEAQDVLADAQSKQDTEQKNYDKALGERNNAQTDVTDAEQKIKDIEAIETGLNDATVKLKTAQDNHTSLINKLEDAKKELIALQEKAEQLKETRDAYQEDVNNSQKVLKDSQAILKFEQNKLDDLTDILKSAIKDVENAENTLKEAQEKLSSAEAYLTKLQTALLELEAAQKLLEEVETIYNGEILKLQDEKDKLGQLQIDLVSAIQNAKTNKDYYEYLLSLLEQEKLEEEKQAIIKSGSIPQAIVDEIGKIVGYTAISGGAAAAGQAIQTVSANRLATSETTSTYSRVARATSEKTLPSTGDAGSVLTLIGLGLTSLGLAGRKRRQD